MIDRLVAATGIVGIFTFGPTWLFLPQRLVPAVATATALGYGFGHRVALMGTCLVIAWTPPPTRRPHGGCLLGHPRTVLRVWVDQRRMLGGLGFWISLGTARVNLLLCSGYALARNPAQTRQNRAISAALLLLVTCAGIAPS